MLRATLLIVSLLLTSCYGWHLRGQQPIPPELRVVAIEPDEPFTPLQRDLREALKLSGVTIVSPDRYAPYLLILSNEEFTKETTALGYDGETKEGDVTFRVTFSLKSIDGNVLIPETCLHSMARIRYNPDALLSQNIQQRLMEGELRRDVVNQIVRRLSHLEPILYETTP